MNFGNISREIEMVKKIATTRLKRIKIASLVSSLFNKVLSILLKNKCNFHSIHFSTWRWETQSFLHFWTRLPITPTCAWSCRNPHFPRDCWKSISKLPKNILKAWKKLWNMKVVHPVENDNHPHCQRLF